MAALYHGTSYVVQLTVSFEMHTVFYAVITVVAVAIMIVAKPTNLSRSGKYTV